MTDNQYCAVKEAPFNLELANHILHVAASEMHHSGSRYERIVMTDHQPTRNEQAVSKLDLANRIDELADQFEAELQRGTTPAVDILLSQVEQPHQPALLRELLLLESHYQHKAGATVDYNAYKSRFPEFSEQINTIQEQNRKALDIVIGQGDTHSSANPAQPTPEKEMALPTEFGRYHVIEPIASGGMGSVHLAEDTKLNRRVALKIPRIDITHDKMIRERFEREARNAAALQHPNICPVYDVGEQDGIFFISMSYLSGTSLEQKLKETGAFPETECVDLIRKLSSALSSAHEKGVVHRDVKPSNVIIDERGEPIIMDFGLAVRTDDIDPRLTEAGTLVGTPMYMSPEQVSGNPGAIGPATDIYSLGVILYQLLTGALPFNGSPTEILAAILRDQPPKPSKLNRDIDPELEAICLKAMSKKAGDRYASMREFSEALEQYLQMKSSRAQAPPTNWLRVAGFAAAACLLLAVVVFQFKTDNGTVKVTVSDPTANVQVLVDGDIVDVKGLDKPLQFKVGPHNLEVKGEGYETIAKSFTVKKGDNPALHIELVRDNQVANTDPSKNGKPSIVEPVTFEEQKFAVERLVALGLQAKLLIGEEETITVTSADQLPKDKFKVIELHYTSERPLLQQDIELIGSLTDLDTLHFFKKPETPITTLEQLKQLKDLKITHFTDNDLKVIGKLKQLKNLALSQQSIYREVKNQTITAAGLDELKHLSELDTLGFSTLKIGDDAGEAFSFLENLPQLTKLSIHGSTITDAPLIFIDKLPELQSLKLDATPITDKGLAYLIECHKLYAMSLNGCINVTDQGIRNLSSLKKLRFLGLDNTKITDAVMPELINRNLNGLHIGNTLITGKGLIQIKKLNEMSSLGLKSLPVHDADLSILSSFPYLDRLVLDKTHVTDAGMDEIAKLNYLHVLELGGTKISDKGLLKIIGMKRLGILNIPKTNVTPAGLDLFKKERAKLELPEVSVTYSPSKVKSSSKDKVMLPQQVSPEEQRFAVERLVSLGMQAKLLIGEEQTLTVTTPDQLPKDKFKVIELKNNSERPLIEQDIELIGALTDLQSLHFFKKPEAPITTLKHLQQLNDLKIHHFTDNDLRVIGGLRQLTSLHLSHTQYEREVKNQRLSAEAFALLGNLSQLHTLGVSSINFENDSVAFSFLEKTNNITHLYIYQCVITDAALKPVGKLSELQRLKLEGCPITDAGLEHLRGCQKLSVISLAGCRKVGDQGVKHLMMIPTLNNLGLSNTKVTDASLQFLSQHDIEGLRIPGTAVTANGLKHLQNMKNMKSLHLGGIPLSDQDLLPLASMQLLHDLSLYKTQNITDAGMEIIAKLDSMQTIDLSGNKITDKGLLKLAKLKHLYSIHAKNTAVTPAGISEFKKTKPGCAITQ